MKAHRAQWGTECWSDARPGGEAEEEAVRRVRTRGRERLARSVVLNSNLNQGHGGAGMLVTSPPTLAEVVFITTMSDLSIWRCSRAIS